MEGIINILKPEFLIETLGLVGVVLIVFAESGLFFSFFLPGDSLLFTAGLFASLGYFNIFLLWIGCVFAAILGDNVGYAFGAKVGPKIFVREDSFFFNKKHIEKTKAFYEKYGKKTIIFARFVPIVRTFAPIFAGVGKMEYKTFFFYNVVGGFSWATFFVFLGFSLGKILPNPDKYVLPIIVVIIFISFLPLIREWLRARKM